MIPKFKLQNVDDKTINLSQVMNKSINYQNLKKSW